MQRRSSHSTLASYTLVFVFLVSLIPSAYGLAYTPLPNAQAVSLHISADGRYVAFATAASNFIYDDMNQLIDIYVWDTHSTNNSIWRVSMSTYKDESWGLSTTAMFVPDNSGVFFNSDSINLIDDQVLPTIETRIWLHNMTTNPTTTKLVSTLADNNSTLNGSTFICGTNYDGSKILLQTWATNAIPAGVTNGVASFSTNQLNQFNVYLKDLRTGELTLVSALSNGNSTATRYAICAPRKQNTGNPRVTRALSADAKWAVFTSGSLNLDVLNRTSGAPALPSIYSTPYNEVYVRNLVANATQLVSRWPDRGLFSDCADASIAPADTQVVFVCRYHNSVPGIGVVTYAVVSCQFYEDYNLDPVCRIISLNDSGVPTRTITDYNFDAPDISESGRFIVYSANPQDMIDDWRFWTDNYVEGLPFQSQGGRILIYDFNTNTTGWIGQSPDPTRYNDGNDLGPSISWDGRYVAFLSSSKNLDPATYNSTDPYAVEVYHYDRQLGILRRATPPACFFPTPEECAKVSYQLDQGAFDITATVTGDAVAYNSFSLTVVDNSLPNGFNGSSLNGVPLIYMRFTLDSLTEMVRPDGGPSAFVSGTHPVLSPDGEWLAYKAFNRPSSTFNYPANFTSGSLFMYNTVFLKHTLVSRSWRRDFRPTTVDDGFKFTQDGRFLLFSTDQELEVFNQTDYYGQGHSDVFLYEVATGRISLETLNQTYVKPLDFPVNESVPLYLSQLRWSCKDPSITNNYDWLVMACQDTQVYNDSRMVDQLNNTQIVLRNRRVDATPEILTRLPSGEHYTMPCRKPVITNNGRYVVALCSSFDSPANNLAYGLYPELDIAAVLFDMNEPYTSPNRTRVVRPPPYRSSWMSLPYVLDVFLPVDYTSQESFFVAFNFIPPFQTGEDGHATICYYYPLTDTTDCPYGARSDGMITIKGMNGDGSLLTVESDAGDLTPYDTNGVSDAFIYNVGENTFTLLSAHDNYFADPELNLTCPGVRPGPRWVCEDGVWFVGGVIRFIIRTPVLVSDNATAAVVNTNAVVSGNLNVSCGGILIFTGNASMYLTGNVHVCGDIFVPAYTGAAFLQSPGCADFTGSTIHLNTTDLFNPGTGRYNLPLGRFNCINSTGTIVINQDGPACRNISQSTEFKGGLLSVVFDVDDSSCEDMVVPTDLLALYLIIPIVGLAVVLTAILVGVPKIRRKIFPYRQRKDETVTMQAAVNPVTGNLASDTQMQEMTSHANRTSTPSSQWVPAKKRTTAEAIDAPTGEQAVPKRKGTTAKAADAPAGEQAVPKRKATTSKPKAAEAAPQTPAEDTVVDIGRSSDALLPPPLSSGSPKTSPKTTPTKKKPTTPTK